MPLVPRSSRSPALAILAVALPLAGCAPWITPGQHAANQGGSGLITDDLPGMRDECEGAPGGTAYFAGEWDIDALGGVDQLAVFANEAWIAEGGVDCWHTFEVFLNTEGDLEDDGFATIGVIFEWVPESSTCRRDDYFVDEEWDTTFLAESEGSTVVLSAPDGTGYAAGDFDGEVIDYTTDGFCIWRHEGIREPTTSGSDDEGPGDAGDGA